MSEIYRSENNGMVFGLCSRLAERFNLDVEIIRTLCVLFTAVNSVGLILYVLCSYILPLE